MYLSYSQWQHKAFFQPGHTARAVTPSTSAKAIMASIAIPATAIPHTVLFLLVNHLLSFLPFHSPSLVNEGPGYNL